MTSRATGGTSWWHDDEKAHSTLSGSRTYRDRARPREYYCHLYSSKSVANQHCLFPFRWECLWTIVITGTYGITHTPQWWTQVGTWQDMFLAYPTKFCSVHRRYIVTYHQEGNQEISSLPTKSSKRDNFHIKSNGKE
ncbi:jg20583 [Pararge aegeria aegeria]|uniref:Jg20583 protein n=1 Tax=Pararge aegeria aegeria TaxID=348720 RepID=A0A8S4RND3_9NEOP|nr:jg20583 [Pararge aegeria aegeria]